MLYVNHVGIYTAVRNKFYYADTSCISIHVFLIIHIFQFFLIDIHI